MFGVVGRVVSRTGRVRWAAPVVRAGVCGVRPLAPRRALCASPQPNDKKARKDEPAKEKEEADEEEEEEDSELSDTEGLSAIAKRNLKAVTALGVAVRYKMPVPAALIPSLYAQYSTLFSTALSNSTRFRGDESLTVRSIEDGALFAYENLMVAVSQGDVEFVHSTCSEELRTALEPIVQHIADGELPATLLTDLLPPSETPSARIVQAYSVPDDPSVPTRLTVVFVCEVKSALGVELLVGNRNASFHTGFTTLQLARHVDVRTGEKSPNWVLGTDLRLREL